MWCEAPVLAGRPRRRRHGRRPSGAILVASGAYIAAYWATDLRDPLAARGATFRTVERAQTWPTDRLGSDPELWATVFGSAIAAAAAHVAWARRRSRRQPWVRASSARWVPTSSPADDTQKGTK
jgi:hypothetical protein